MLWRYHWISFSLALNAYVLVETNAPIWQYIAIPGCVIFAAWIGVRAAECWKDGKWGSATGASLMFVMTVLANVYVAITAAALTHDAAIGSRSAKIQRTDSIAGEIKDTKEELRRQRSATAGAPEGQIQAVIDRLEANPMFREEKRSNRCANDTAAESRTLCDQWRDEKGRLAAAQRITVLEERLGKLQQLSWNGTAATEQMIEADPGAKAMATITGLSEKLITAGFTGYLAVLLELIAAFAPAFCSPRPEPGEGSRNPISKTKPNSVAAKVRAGLRGAHQGAKVAEKVRNPCSEPVLAKPADPFSTWVAAKTYRDEKGHVNASALGESYAAWAAGSELPPITATMLGRKLRAMGIEKRKIGGRMAYTGIAIKSAPVLTVVGRTPENIARRAGTSTEI